MFKAAQIPEDYTQYATLGVGAINVLMTILSVRATLEVFETQATFENLNILFIMDLCCVPGDPGGQEWASPLTAHRNGGYGCCTDHHDSRLGSAVHIQLVLLHQHCHHCHIRGGICCGTR